MENQKTQVSRNLAEAMKIQLSDIPRIIAKEIQPVIDVTSTELKRINKISNIDTTSNGTITILTTPATSTRQKYLLCGFNASMCADALNTNTTYTIYATIGGASTVIFRGVKTTLTAFNNSINCIFPFPVEIDAGTNITASNTVAGGGVSEFNVTLYGITEEVL